MSKTISLTIPFDDVKGLKQGASILNGLAMAAHIELAGGISIESDADTDTAIDSDDIIQNNVGVELDSAGLPWDARIHNKDRKKTAKDQSWQRIRNIEKNKPGLVEQVEAELRTAMAAPTAAISESNTVAGPSAPTGPTGPAGPSAPDAPAATITKYKHPDGPLYTMEELTSAGWTEEQVKKLPASEVAVEIEETTDTDDLTFAAFMRLNTAAIAAGDHTPEDVNAACAKHGIASVPILAARPDLVSVVAAELDLS